MILYAMILECIKIERKWYSGYSKINSGSAYLSLLSEDFTIAKYMNSNIHNENVLEQ